MTTNWIYIIDTLFSAYLQISDLTSKFYVICFNFRTKYVKLRI